MQAAKFGGLFDSIIGAVTTVLPFLTQQGQTTQGQAKGLAAIRAYVNQVLAGLDTIKQQVGALSLQQRQQVAQQVAQQVNDIVSTLTNPQYVYQAKRGDDAAALQNGIKRAGLKAQEIAALLTNQTVANTPVTGTPTGAITPTTQTTQTPVIYQQATEDGNKDLLLYGGIGLAILLLLRK